MGLCSLLHGVHLLSLSLCAWKESSIPGYFSCFHSHVFVQGFYPGWYDDKGNSAVAPQIKGKEQIKTKQSPEPGSQQPEGWEKCHARDFAVC